MLRIVSGLSAGQVLQRNKQNKAGAKLKLAGSARGPVTATITDGKGKALPGWKGKKLVVRKKESCAAELRGIPADGPYTLQLECGGESVRVQNFYVGDVWVLAGQSNMQGCGNREGAAPKHPLVRLLNMRREWMQASEPLHVLGESPDGVHNGGEQNTRAEANRFRKETPKGTGAGLYFARLMVETTGVPQGLIATAHGGTSMTQWTPKRKLDGKTGLYGSALASVEATGQPVAGVLWYQGESDAGPDAAPLYTGRMKKLIAAWRKDTRQRDLPWIIVQLANVYGTRTAEAEQCWNSVQEQQRLLPKAVKKLGVVAAVDLPLDDNIHVSADGHRVLAKRLAMEAERIVLGKRQLPPPALKKISNPVMPKLPNGKSGPGRVIEVTYDNVAGGLRADGVPSGFRIVDEEGRDRRSVFRVTLHGDKARLHISEAGDDHKLHYGLGCTTYCNLTDGRGHGLPVFGPADIGQPRATLPFVARWKAHPPMESDRPLDALAKPPAKLPAGKAKTYVDDIFNLDGFVNEHNNWTGHVGLAFFTAKIKAPEAMKLEVLLGYDGPFRLWVDGKPVFTDMLGVNPCFADESSTRLSLTKGTHQFTVGMDIRHGQAWGFFLRFVRQDVPVAKIRSKQYAKLSYST